MVTASHNPKQDNGLKIFDRDGSMLEGSWEKLAERMVNTEDLGEFLNELDNGKIEGYETVKVVFDSKPLVFIGYDSRESSLRLSEAMINGIEILGGRVVNYGLVTTPQLHWLTARCNEIGQEKYLEVKA